MKIGIVADDYKLPKFRELLTGAGLAFEEKGAFTEGTTVITIETDNKELVHNLCRQVEAWAHLRQ